MKQLLLKAAVWAKSKERFAKNYCLMTGCNRWIVIVIVIVIVVVIVIIIVVVVVAIVGRNWWIVVGVLCMLCATNKNATENCKNGD